MKFILFVFWLIIQTASAAPAQYNILKCPPGFTPVMDGDLAEWTDEYFIDSLWSDDNIFSRDDSLWTREDYQMGAYAAWDDDKIYFAVIIVADDRMLNCGTQDGWSKCDNIKINPGGKAVAFYVWANGTFYINPSCPFNYGSSLFIGGNPSGNGTFPTYEFSLSKSVVDPYGYGSFQLCVGSEDQDSISAWNESYLGIGVECMGDKHVWNDGRWNNPMFYPTFTLGQVHIESHLTAKAPETLTAIPNPFAPSTTLSYNVKSTGSLKIYDMSGKEVKRFGISGAGRAVWDAAGLAAGVYLARLVSGKDVRNTRLFLVR